MKRCNRFCRQENQPYLQFNFQKSLRKYEKIPYKKIKIQQQISPNTQHLQTTLQNKNTSFQEVQQLHPIKSNSQIAPNQQKPQQNESSPIEQLTLLNQKKQNQYAKLDEIDIFFHKDSQNNEVKQQQADVDLLVTKKDKQKLLLQQHECFDHSLLQSQLQQKQEEREQSKGGRFHLNSNVFISKRSIQRLAKSKDQQFIVNQLLKNRAYLQNQRQLIYARLKEYMSSK